MNCKRELKRRLESRFSRWLSSGQCLRAFSAPGLEAIRRRVLASKRKALTPYLSGSTCDRLESHGCIGNRKLTGFVYVADPELSVWLNVL